MPPKSKSAMSRIQNLGSNAKKRPTVTIEDVEDEGEPYNPSPSHSNDPVDSEGDFVEAEDVPWTSYITSNHVCRGSASPN
jgi:hypothetical protein